MVTEPSSRTSALTELGEAQAAAMVNANRSPADRAGWVLMNSPLRPHHPGLVSLPVALLLGLALVVQLLALGDAQFHFRPALGIEIHFERYQRHAFALDGGRQLRRLALVNQQLPHPFRFMVEPAGLGVFG